MEKVKREIFRAYDVRGIYPDEINADVVKQIGNAMVRHEEAKTLVVGEDGRTSSPELRQAVIEGILMAGCGVIYIGQCTTPLFYFAVKELKAEGGIMVTASHNPKEYNGLKLVGLGALPIGLDEGLDEIAELVQGELSQDNPGKLEEHKDIADKYIKFLTEHSDFVTGEIKEKIVVDLGNGASIFTVPKILEDLDIQALKINEELDGVFPGRGPDPIKPGALKELSEKVIAERALFGVAFDGDADRMTIVDEKGEVVSAQYILALLWQEQGANIPVVYDLRFSRAVRDVFGGYGTRSMVGHTNISDMMREVHAPLGGETSGHFFFGEMNYTESSELAMLRLLKFVSASGKLLSELVSPLQKYVYSGEINISWSGDKEKLFNKLKEEYSQDKWDAFDGLTIDLWGSEEWWFNLRASNTEPLLRLIVEAQNKDLLEKKVEEIISLIQASE